MSTGKNSSLGFWANVTDGRDNPTLTLAVETETGQPIVMKIRDSESLETLVLIHVPVFAAQSIGQALMLASSMKTEEAADAMRGGDG